MLSYFGARHHQNPTVTSVPSGIYIYMFPLEAGQGPVMLLAGWIMSTTPTPVVIPVQGPCLLRLGAKWPVPPPPPPNRPSPPCLLRGGVNMCRPCQAGGLPLPNIVYWSSHNQSCCFSPGSTVWKMACIMWERDRSLGILDFTRGCIFKNNSFGLLCGNCKRQRERERERESAHMRALTKKKKKKNKKKGRCTNS